MKRSKEFRLAQREKAISQLLKLCDKPKPKQIRKPSKTKHSFVMCDKCKMANITISHECGVRQ